MLKHLLLFFMFSIWIFVRLPAQEKINAKTNAKKQKDSDSDNNSKKKKKIEFKSNKNSTRVLYGTASFYATKFNGRKTASGEIYDNAKMTAACNVLALGTWIKVTNLRNGRSVIVKVNDRLHARMTRLVDLSRSAAKKLNYIKSGLTKIKVEVIGKKYLMTE